MDSAHAQKPNIQTCADVQLQCMVSLASRATCREVYIYQVCTGKPPVLAQVMSSHQGTVIALQNKALFRSCTEWISPNVLKRATNHLLCT